MNHSWLFSLSVGATTMFVKGIVPVLLGGRRVARKFERVVSLTPCAMFAALAATQAFFDGGSYELDARLVGVTVGAVAMLCRAPLLAIVALAATTTALIRLVLG